jgi:hypothetical protein
VEIIVILPSGFKVLGISGKVTGSSISFGVCAQHDEARKK